MTPPSDIAIPNGRYLIEAERKRQIDQEGYTPEYDKRFNNVTQLLNAGDAYAIHSALVWPWNKQLFKPTNRLRDLIKAGALYAAAYEMSGPGESRGHRQMLTCAELIDQMMAEAVKIMSEHA